MWEDLKHHIDTMGEMYLREQMQTLIQLNSPRLYQTQQQQQVYSVLPFCTGVTD